MLFDPKRISFLHPSALMYELLILHELQKDKFILSPRGAVRELTDTMVRGYLARFVEAGFVEISLENGSKVYCLTPAGEQRLHTLLVDYVQELIALYGDAREIFRKRLAEFYLQGVRQVAFCPIGETAEVVYRALQDSGLALVAAVDDDPLKWDMPFHEVSIKSVDALAASRIDAVIVTTCAFRSEITRRLQALNLLDVRILLL